MSVLLAVKMDLAIPAGAGLEAVNGAFPIEGAYRMLELPGLQWKIWGDRHEQKRGLRILSVCDNGGCKAPCGRGCGPAAGAARHQQCDNSDLGAGCREDENHPRPH